MNKSLLGNIKIPGYLIRKTIQLTERKHKQYEIQGRVHHNRKININQLTATTCTISSSSKATLGRFSFDSIRILALVSLLNSVMIAPPLPIRQPIREVGTSRRVVNEIIPESLSTFSLHLGCKRNAASSVGEYESSKN